MAATAPAATPPSPAARRSSRAPVRLWLFAICVLVFAMIMVGGATRLTDSGLSITEWQPILGAIPPLTEADWQAAFAKYRQIPEFRLVNPDMTLAAFKTIYWWEWTHRFLGRVIGVAFLVPFLVFWATGRIGRATMPKLVAIFVLGGLQGVLGWYMVMSGLVDRVDVSQYRLAGHLSLAVLILGAVLWVALEIGDERPARAGAPVARGLIASAAGLAVLVVAQIFLGALVAGLDAGLSHNTWPLMDGRLVPDGLGVMRPWYANPFENALTVQFDHRVAAYALGLWALVHAAAVGRRAWPGPQAVSALLLLLAVAGQICLGIWTLLARAPIGLSLLHQAGAVIVVMAAVVHLHMMVRGRASRPDEAQTLARA